jgi:hypothetical protein
LLNSTLVPSLESLPDTIGWGWRPFAFNLARRLGYRVDAFEGDFLCPAGQRDETPSDRIYRMRQMSQNIDGLVLSTQVHLEQFSQ